MVCNNKIQEIKKLLHETKLKRPAFDFSVRPGTLGFHQEALKKEMSKRKKDINGVKRDWEKLKSMRT